MNGRDIYGKLQEKFPMPRNAWRPFKAIGCGPYCIHSSFFSLAFNALCTGNMSMVFQSYKLFSKLGEEVTLL